MSAKHILVSFLVTFVGVAVIARVQALRSLAGL